MESRIKTPSGLCLERLHTCLPQHEDVSCSEDAMLVLENCKRERREEVDLTSIPMVESFRDPVCPRRRCSIGKAPWR
jgi:hypothetical protein